MTTEEVCEALGISAPTARDWADKGTIRAARLPGGRRLYKYDRAHVEQLVRDMAGVRHG